MVQAYTQAYRSYPQLPVGSCVTARCRGSSPIGVDSALVWLAVRVAEVRCRVPGRGEVVAAGHGADRVPHRGTLRPAVLQSFRDRDTERVWRRERVPRLGPDVQRQAHKRLALLHRAETLEDLRVIRGNRLEKLRGDRAGQHSIRVNEQWRICFRWTDHGPVDVEVVDYH